MGLLDFFRRKPVVDPRMQINPKTLQVAEAIENYADFWYGAYDYWWSNGRQWGMMGSMPAVGGTSNRAFGYDAYVFRTEQELRVQRDSCRWIYAKESIARSIVAHQIAFILGAGATYRVQAKQDRDLDEGIIKLAQKPIDDFIKLQKWKIRERECVESLIVDGEFFLRRFIKDGQVYYRRIEPEHITNMPGKTMNDGWFLGVHVEQDDPESVIGYGYHPYPSTEWKEIPADEIIHVKANVTSNVTRGVSDLYCMLDDIDRAGKLFDCVISGATARAEIPYFRSHMNPTPTSVVGFADSLKDRSRINPVTGKTERYKDVKPGTVVDHGENIEFKTMPAGDVESNLAALQASLRLIGNRFAQPEYMSSGDASNSNMASLQISGGPFCRGIEIRQDNLKPFFEAVMMPVLVQGSVNGDFPRANLQSLEIVIDFPSPVIEDKLQQAQVDQIYLGTGVTAPQIVAQKLGLDPAEVQILRDEYNDANLLTAGGGDLAAMDLESKKGGEDGEE